MRFSCSCLQGTWEFLYEEKVDEQIMRQTWRGTEWLCGNDTHGHITDLFLCSFSDVFFIMLSLSLGGTNNQ